MDCYIYGESDIVAVIEMLEDSWGLNYGWNNIKVCIISLLVLRNTIWHFHEFLYSAHFYQSDKSAHWATYKESAA